MFNASAPVYSAEDLLVLKEWFKYVFDIFSNKRVTVKQIRNVFKDSRGGEHAVDMFAKTVLVMSGKPQLVDVLQTIYKVAVKEYVHGTDTHLLLFLLFKKVSNSGTVTFPSLTALHEELIRVFKRTHL